MSTECLESVLDAAGEFAKYTRGLNVGQQRLIFSIAVIAHDAVCITHLRLTADWRHSSAGIHGM